MAAPRLPDATALGGVANAASTRPMSSIDASPIGQVMEENNAKFQRGSRGFDSLAGELNADTRKDASLADGQNRTDFLVAKIGLDNERDNERDPEKLAQFPDRYRQLQQDYASRFTDPVQRQKFVQDYAPDLAKSAFRAGDIRTQVVNDQTKANVLTTLESLRQKGLTATDDKTKEAVRIEAFSQFQRLKDAGIMDATQETLARQKWVKDYTYDSINMLPPSQRLQAVDGWRGALKAKESGGNAGSINQFGYTGLYQFGAPRLASMGVYTPGSGENLGTWSQTGQNAPGKWSGTFSIPGFPEVKTLSDFRANPAAQEAVFDMHQRKMDQEIQQNGLDKYIGQTVGGVPITREGIYSMIHLGGVGGAQNALASGGASDARDANGATVLQYARMGQAGPSKMLGLLDPTQVKELRDGAARDLAAQNRLSAQEDAAAAAQQEAQRKLQLNNLETGILDGTKGREDIIHARQQGWLTDYDEINKVQGIADKVEKQQGDARAWQDVVDGRRSLNPWDKGDKDIASAGVEALVKGSNGQITRAAAGLMVYQKTGVLPADSAVAMRGALSSNQPDKVAEAGNVAGNLMLSNPGAFAGVEGREQLETLGSAFNHYVHELGMTRDEAAQKILADNQRLAGGDAKVDDKVAKSFHDDVKKNAISQLEGGSFAGSGWVFSNKIGDAQRQAAAEDYAELAESNFRQFGNPDVAKAYAMNKMKQLYGVSNGTLVKYPPEKNYPAVNGGHDWLYQQAAEEVKARTGEKVDPSSIYFVPVDRQRTALAYEAGKPAPYNLVYTHKVDGQTMVSMLYPAQGATAAFVGDPKPLLDKATADRQAAFTAADQIRKGIKAPYTAADMPENKGILGLQKNTPEERQSMADKMNAGRAEARATTHEAAGLSAGAFGAVKDLVDNTPRNPLKGKFNILPSSSPTLPGGKK